MSLKAFHFVFIIISILLSTYFGGWCVQNYGETHSSSVLLMGIGSFLAAAILVVYFAWFLKKLKNLSYLVLPLVAVSSLVLYSKPALACSVCLGNPSSPMVKSANSGVLFLLAVITTVLVGFAGLFIFWGVRSHRLNSI